MLSFKYFLKEQEDPEEGASRQIKHLTHVEDSHLQTGEKGAEHAERSPAMRYTEELTRLWKFGARQEDLDKKSLDTHKAIQKILTDIWEISPTELEK